ncbi:MAG: hypothetical protein RIC95_03610 [Vicingaceae bacterium]
MSNTSSLNAQNNEIFEAFMGGYYQVNELYEVGGEWTYSVSLNGKNKGELVLLKKEDANHYTFKGKPLKPAVSYNEKNNITIMAPPILGYEFLNKVSFLSFSEEIVMVQYELEGKGNPLINSEGISKQKLAIEFEYEGQKIDSVTFVSDYKYQKLNMSFMGEIVECFKEVLTTHCKAGSFITTSYFDPLTYGYLEFKIEMPDGDKLEFQLEKVDLN